MYNFDNEINRRGTNSLKWDALNERYGNPDLLPLWVADMDWETPSFIKEAITKQIADTPVLGYTITPPEYKSTIRKWILDHHQWDVKDEWLSFVPGIVKGIGMIINVFLKEDEKVIVQPPVYHPFFLTAQGNKREVVWNPLKPVYNNDGSLKTYEMDFDNLKKVCDEKCRLLILAKTHNLIVVSDEIHCDLAIFGHKHTPFATVSKEAAEVSITFSAPTKTFNIAGVISSWAIVINDDLRRKFYGWLEANELNEPTMFAPVATIAALSQGEPWHREMLAYLEDNIRFIEDFCHENIPTIKPVRPQASYLVWLDCRALRLPHRTLEKLFTDKAGLALNSGRIFGKQGEGFMRLNAGCPRSTLQRALTQLKTAIEG